MARYALLLRGVNVGTKNTLPMAELRKMLAAIGCTDVSTYLQSGNAVFETKLRPTPLAKALAPALDRYMGRPIATTLRTEAELAAIVAGNPFADVMTEPKYLCVTFLEEPPAKEALAPLRSQDFAPERFHVAGREIYTWYPNGQARSALAVALAKVPARGAVTTRNWNTVTKLLSLVREGPAPLELSPPGPLRARGARRRPGPPRG
ncbi:MAG: DUF1697 domain-containing protein [Labilithrix sp.]|nr:DUF1697 domain-containing protein [Labilithrix sp.]MCW5812497.1 DUF1697 domain-containing protein [Labilithrix sp.]